jgi:hypothetical protein
MSGLPGTHVRPHRKRLASGASAISAGTDFFPSLRPAIKGGRLYDFAYTLLFSKTTAGTVTFQLKNSAAVNFTQLRAWMLVTPQVAVLGSLSNIASARVAGNPSATFPATASLADATSFQAYVWGWCVPASDTRLSIAPSAYGAGTITTLADSLIVIEDHGPYTTDYGDFA